MQFPAWLVDKSRKRILVISIIVIASLLFTFGDTTNQARAATKDTTNRTQAMLIDFTEAMSIIDAQRAQSYQALWTMSNLDHSNAFQSVDSYYGQARDYYDTNIESQVNQWLTNLNNEGQSNEPLNNNSNDQALITNAITADYQLIAWTNGVAKSASSGLTPPDSSPADSKIDLKKFLEFRDAFNNGFGAITSACMQQIWAEEQWQQAVDLQSPSPSSQPLPQCQPLQPSQP